MVHEGQQVAEAIAYTTVFVLVKELFADVSSDLAPGLQHLVQQPALRWLPRPVYGPYRFHFHQRPPIHDCLLGYLHQTDQHSAAELRPIDQTAKHAVAPGVTAVVDYYQSQRRLSFSIFSLILTAMAYDQLS